MLTCLVAAPLACDPAAEARPQAASSPSLPAEDPSLDSLCGNGVHDSDAAEACDGAPPPGVTCESQGYAGGDLHCSAGCTLSYAACFRCGDGVRNGTEACDGDDFGSFQCQDADAHSLGRPTCRDDCTVDVSSCAHVCGDGSIEGNEQCDGQALDGLACSDLGYDDGALGCNTACVFDVDACVNIPCKALGDPCETDGECCGPPHGEGRCDEVCR